MIDRKGGYVEQKLVNVGGRNLAVTVDGEGDKTVVFLHGLTGQQNNFYHLIERLKPFCTTVAVDLAGRGMSDPTPKSSVPQHATDVIVLLKQLQIEEPILVGHSMGAFIASIIASELPNVKGAVYLDGACKIEPSMSEALKPSLGRLQKQYDSKQAYLQEMQQLYSFLGITWTDTIEQSVLYEVKEEDGVWKTAMHAQNILEDLQGFADYDVKIIAEKVSCPVFLVIATGGIGFMPALFNETLFEPTIAHTKQIEVIQTSSNHYTMVGVEQAEMNDKVAAFIARL